MSRHTSPGRQACRCEAVVLENTLIYPKANPEASMACPCAGQGGPARCGHAAPAGELPAGAGRRPRAARIAAGAAWAGPSRLRQAAVFVSLSCVLPVCCVYISNHVGVCCSGISGMMKGACHADPLMRGWLTCNSHHSHDMHLGLHMFMKRLSRTVEVPSSCGTRPSTACSRTLPLFHSTKLHPASKPRLRQPRAPAAYAVLVSESTAPECSPISDSSSKVHGNGMHAVVVGAGPAGCVTAMLLAMRGFTVDVFEQRRCPRTAAQDPGGVRTYLMILNGR